MGVTLIKVSRSSIHKGNHGIPGRQMQGNGIITSKPSNRKYVSTEHTTYWIRGQSIISM
jgi:hypothetical protein